MLNSYKVKQLVRAKSNPRHGVGVIMKTEKDFCFVTFPKSELGYQKEIKFHFTNLTPVLIENNKKSEDTSELQELLKKLR